MHPSVRRSVVAAVVMFLPLVPGSVLMAQRAGAPTGGTWGGEAGVGNGIGQSASLLLFQSARWALLAGGSVESSAFDNGGLIGTRRTTITSLRLGARRYARTGLGVRPIAGLGLTIFDGTSIDTNVGAYGELGAVYFFNPHVSLGASAEANIGTAGGNGTNFGVSLGRLIGAVYF